MNFQKRKRVMCNSKGSVASVGRVMKRALNRNGGSLRKQSEFDKM
jgi:hypothetical protein